LEKAIPFLNGFWYFGIKKRKQSWELAGDERILRSFGKGTFWKSHFIIIPPEG
jgi:hypothetical protein